MISLPLSNTDATISADAPDPLDALTLGWQGLEEQWASSVALGFYETFPNAVLPGLETTIPSADMIANGQGDLAEPSAIPNASSFGGVLANANAFLEADWLESGGSAGAGFPPTAGALDPFLAQTLLSALGDAGVSALVPRALTTSQPIASMAPGFTQTIYLTQDGSVWTMGSNSRGQLGDGAIGRADWSSAPVSVALPGPMKQVGSGTALCWALSADGRSAYAWGDNTYGQLGIGDPSVRYSDTPVQIKFNLPPGVTIVSMGGGLWCTLALLSNGQVMAWGANQFGQCGQNPAKAGQYIGAPTLIPGLTDVTELASGDNYSMALKADGTVWAWGQNTNGEVGPSGPHPQAYAHTFVPVQVTGLPYIEKIVAGGKNGIALGAGGHVWEWGRDKFGELGRGVLDLSDGAHPTPKTVRGLPTIVSLASQGPTVLAADAYGHVYAWGFDKWGAVGDGGTANTGTPQLVLTLPTSPDATEPSVQVAAAHRSSYAFNVITGETYAWGENNYGQIGTPANGSPNSTPVNITDEILPTLRPREGGRLNLAAQARLSSADVLVDYSTGARIVLDIGAGQDAIHDASESGWGRPEAYVSTGSGKGMDILTVPHLDASTLTEILANAPYGGSSMMLLVSSGDSTALIGVSKMQLSAQPGDLALYGHSHS